MSAIHKQKAPIKMVALTPANFENITWYTLPNDYRKSQNSIISIMKARFELTGMYAVTRVLQFYDNSTNKLIEEYRK